MKPNKSMITAIAIVGILAVLIGAFGAHGLRPRLTDAQLATYHTGVSYQFYHLLAMAFSYILYVLHSNKWSRIAFWSFLLGIILFCGSLYLLSTRDLLGIINYKWIGPLTPIGGLCFIMGWAMLLISVFNGHQETYKS